MDISQTEEAMDEVVLDLNAPLAHNINGSQFAILLASTENLHRFLRANMVIADASYCRRCRVSTIFLFNVFGILQCLTK